MKRWYQVPAFHNKATKDGDTYAKTGDALDGAPEGAGDYVTVVMPVAMLAS